MLLIIDESFIDFSGGSSVLDHLKREPLNNILIVKSLCKVYGVPGVRLGVAYICDPNVKSRIAA
jgi:histidinol-phosphate/aromatic aminotransferase/cobyric acid decarboxylase-like protein